MAQERRMGNSKVRELKFPRHLQVQVAVLAMLLVAGTAAGKQATPDSLFVFGDSYADTGNRNKTDPATFQSWQYPYGITWGSGRFSDGRVSTDYFAELFGLPPLKTHASISYSTSPIELRQGVNFATGGSGAFPVSVPVPNIFQQVDQFLELLREFPNLYSLEKSVVYISCGGNDYGQLQIDNPNAGLEDYIDLANRIAQAIRQNVETLYEAGLRNFVISNIPKGGCTPATTGQNATECVETLTPIVLYHNANLLGVLTDLQTKLPEASFVELDIFKAFNYVIDNHQIFGITNKLGACCAPVPELPHGNCGDYDAEGNPLFTVCLDRRGDYFFWDGVHPTQASWGAVTNLFYSGWEFTALSPNLLVWLNSLGLDTGPKAPEIFYEAIAQALVESLAPDYPHILSLLNTSGALSYLPASLSKLAPLTVFLPSEAAIEEQLGADFWQTWPALSTEVALVQVVYGWWPAEFLRVLSNGYSLQTVGGSKLQVFNERGNVFLTAGVDGSEVALLEPNFFDAFGVVLVHKTSALALPSQLHFYPSLLKCSPARFR